MLINCVAYQGGKKLRDIGVAEIHEYADKPDCFFWVALRDANAEELEQMKHEFGLHELAVEDAHYENHQRPKIEEYGDTPETRRRAADGIGGASARRTRTGSVR